MIRRAILVVVAAVACGSEPLDEPTACDLDGYHACSDACVPGGEARPDCAGATIRAECGRYDLDASGRVTYSDFLPVLQGCEAARP